MHKVDKGRRQALVMLSTGLLTSSLPCLVNAGEKMELIVDHVMFPLYFNNQFLEVVEEVWKELNVGKVTIGKQNPAFKGVYLAPMPSLEPEVMARDWTVMMAMTAGLFVAAYGFRGKGRINRIEGSLLLIAFTAYNTWLVVSVLSK
ncbi:MAG: hypothetical protein R3E89_05110 [Thiolinea sp.]